MKHMQKESIPPQENKPVQYNRYFQNIRKYLRELSVVVAGIVITFCQWVDHWASGEKDAEELSAGCEVRVGGKPVTGRG